MDNENIELTKQQSNVMLQNINSTNYNKITKLFHDATHEYANINIHEPYFSVKKK